MSETDIAPDWRTALKTFCASDPHKKQELSDLLIVSPRTIERWISGQSRPQKPEYIYKLAGVSTELHELLAQTFPDAFQHPRRALPVQQMHIPAEFYYRVVRAFAYGPRASQRWTIWNLVSNGLIQQLDSDHQGLMVVTVRQEGDQLVLGEAAGNGNHLWATRQLVSSSCPTPWLIQAVSRGQPFFVQSCVDADLDVPLCFYRREAIQAVAFFPLYRGALLGSGMLVCAPETDFFTPVRQALIEEYSCLLTLAFDVAGE